MNNNATRINSLISDIGLINTEFVDCDSASGVLKIGFKRDRPGELCKRYICEFQSYITFKVTHEDFDYKNDDVPRIQEPASEVYGNLLCYSESKWLDMYVDTTMFIHGKKNLPKHYFFIATEDRVEVLSHHEPIISRS